MAKRGWSIAATVAGSLLLAACAMNGGQKTAGPTVDSLQLASMSAAIEAGEYKKIEAIIVDRGGVVVFEGY